MLSLVALLFSITTFAVKVTYGSLECLKNEQSIAVSLDLTNTTYMTKYSVESFLGKYPRVNDWKERSIQYFIKEFNKNAYNIGLYVVADNETEYEMQIVPSDIKADGRFVKVTVNIVKKETKETMASLLLNSSDGDNDDEITFRDTMRNLGELLGRFFNTKMKKL